MGTEVVVKGKGGLPSKLEKELAKYAQEAAAQAPVVSGRYISTQGGHFSYQGANLGDQLSVVVLDTAYDNAFYTEAFDPDNPQPPVCFAIGKIEADLKPSAQAPKPQAARCAECRYNQFGTAEVGKGKACKNVIRLALLPYDASGNLKDAESALLKLMPTAVRPWGAYVRKLTALEGRPPFGVVTHLKIVATKKGVGHTVVAELEKRCSDKEVKIALERRQGVEAELLADYDTSRSAAPSAGNGRKVIEVKSGKGRKAEKARGW
jgi:hypothetical protein